jgi:hypothetical protein
MVEGISLRVWHPATAELERDPQAAIKEPALIVARSMYPELRFTGRVLLVELNELGPDLHEVALEIITDKEEQA